jgi:hypothetical protein
LPQEIKKAPERAFVTYCLLMGPKSWFNYNYDAKNLWSGVEVNMTMFDYVWGEVFRDIDITKNLDKLTAPVFLALGRYDYLVPPACGKMSESILKISPFAYLRKAVTRHILKNQSFLIKNYWGGFQRYNQAMSYQNSYNW